MEDFLSDCFNLTSKRTIVSRQPSGDEKLKLTLPPQLGIPHRELQVSSRDTLCTITTPHAFARPLPHSRKYFIISFVHFRPCRYPTCHLKILVLNIQPENQMSHGLKDVDFNHITVNLLGRTTGNGDDLA